MRAGRVRGARSSGSGLRSCRSENSRPSPQETVHVGHHHLDRKQQPGPPGQFTDPVTSAPHRPVPGPASEKRHRPPWIRRRSPNQPVVKTKKVKTCPAHLPMHYPRYGLPWAPARVRQAVPAAAPGRPRLAAANCTSPTPSSAKRTSTPTRTCPARSSRCRYTLPARGR